MSVPVEVLGADFVEHNVRHYGYDYETMMVALERAGYEINYPWCKKVHPTIAVSQHTKRVFFETFRHTYDRLLKFY
jgi:hypothetical protein